MAKRKKINKRAVILVAAFGGVFLIGGMYVVVKMLPRNHGALAQMARATLQRGDPRGADKLLGEAIGAAARDPDARAGYLYERAKLRSDWAMTGLELSAMERDELRKTAISNVEAALRDRPDYVEARHLLCEMWWAASHPYDDILTRGGDEMANQRFIKEADRLLALTPDDARTYFRRGLAHAKVALAVGGEHVTNAIADLRKAIELKKDEVVYWQRLVELLDRLDRPEEAEAAYKEAIETNPSNAELRVQYASRLANLKRFKEAQEQIDEAIRRAPNEATGKLALAESLQRNGQPDKAMEALQEAKQIDPTDPRSYLMLANLYQSTRNLGKAIEVLREGRETLTKQATSGPTSSPLSQTKMAMARLQLDYMLGNYLLDMAIRDPSKKTELIAEVQGMVQQLERLVVDNPMKLKLQGRLAKAQGNLAEATRLLERANQGFRGTDRGTLAILIELYERQKMPTKAEALVDSMLQMPENKQNPALLFEKAKFEIRARQYSEAADHIRQVQEIDPRFEAAANMVKALEFMAGRGTEIPAEVEVTPDVASLIMERAAAAWDMAQRDRAISLLESLLTRASDNVAVITRLVQYYVSANLNDKAQSLLAQARAHLTDPDAQAQLAELAELTGAKTPEERMNIRLRAIDKIQDPHDKAIQKAGLYALYDKEKEYVEQLNEALRINPGSKIGINGLFNYYVAKKDWAQAERLAKIAQDGDFDEVGGRTYAATLAMAKQNYSEVIALLTEVLGMRPEFLRVRILLGDAYRENGQMDKAEQTYRSALEYDRNFETAMVRLAMIAFRQRKYTDYRNLVERAYNNGSRDPFILQQYLRIKEQEAPATAIQERERIFAQNPADLQNAVALGALYERFDQLANAEKMFRFVYDNSSNKILGAQQLGGFYARTKRTGDVDKLIEDLLTKTTDKTAAYVLYGQILAGYDMAKAGAAFDRAVQEDSKSVIAAVMRARFMALKGQFKDAADAMTKCIEATPALKGQAEEFELVNWRIRAEQFDEAAKRIDQMLADKPNSMPAMILKSSLAVARRDYKSAEEQLTATMRANPVSAEPLVRRAQLYRLQGNNERAKADLEAAARLTDSPDVGVQLAQVYTMLFDFEKARSTYIEVNTRQPDYEPAVMGLAELYLQTGNLRPLESLLTAAKRNFPRDQRYLIYEGRMCHFRRDEPQRIAALREALKLNPEYEPAVTEYFDALMDNKQFDLLKEAINEYIKAPQFKGMALAAGAWMNFEQKNVSQANADFQAAIKEATPDQFDFVIAEMRRAFGDKGTCANATEWLKIRPDHWMLPFQLGIATDECGDYLGAEQLLLTSLKLAATPEDRASVQALLGTVYLQMSERGMRGDDYNTKAEQALLQAYRYLDTDIRVINNLAYLYVNQNKPSVALVYAEKAAKQMPSASVLDTYGWTLAQLKRFDEAEQQLARAVNLDDKLAYARYHLGWVYEQTSRPNLAVNQYRQGLEMVAKDEPLYRDIADGLQRLQH